MRKSFLKISKRIVTITGMTMLFWMGTYSTTLAVSEKPRVIVSTDIGGTDFDDFQSLIHLLLFSDKMEIEGLISSPWGSERDRVKQIYKVIDKYEIDYPFLKDSSKDYPTPDYLRSVTKQGGLDSAPYEGYSSPTAGSKQIIKAAKKEDYRPLWVLIWGGIDDLAQALHDDPSIADKLHVYYIGGPNKKWATSAYSYIAKNFPKLFMIENNSSYRGWFTGGDQTDGLNGETFIEEHLKNHGALGNLFVQYGSGKFKMGDTPSVAYVLGENPENPAQDSKGGGRFVRAWDRPFYTFKRPLNINDKVETYSIVEIVVHPSGKAPVNTTASLVVPASAKSVNHFTGYQTADGAWHFRFSPKASQEWTYTIESNWSELNDSIGGTFVSKPVSLEKASQVSNKYPNWWTDNPDPILSEVVKPYGLQYGIKTINQWRSAYLNEFAKRAERLVISKK